MRGITLVAFGIIIISFLIAFLGYLFLVYTEKTTLGEEVSFFSLSFNKKVTIFVGVMETISVFLTIFIANKRVKRSEELLIYIVLFELLFIAALIDLKQSIIPNTIIVSGLILWIIAVSLRVIIGRKTFWNVLKPSLIGGAVVGGILLIIALIVKTALGMGDVKLFFVLGLILGLSNTYLLLLVTVVIMALVSIVLLILKKVDRKSLIPMAPFVAVGYVICLLLGM